MSGLLEVLEGTWEGSGRGEYPTIESFDYHETITFTRLAGKPLLAYSQRTRASDGGPLHAETGYLRFGADTVELVIAQPTGIVEAHRGTIAGGRLDFVPVGLVATPSAVEVSEVRRSIEVEGDVLSYSLHVAAVGEPLTLHLTATLHRQPLSP